MRWMLLVALVVTTAAQALPPKPSIAQGVRDAKFSKKVDCKAASPARESSQSALYQNTRTKEIISKTEHWLSIAIECRTFDVIPGHPKAVRKFDGRFSYKSLGGAWIFDSWLEWDVWLEGMPPLDKSIVEKGVADPLKILDWNHLLSTPQIHSYGLRKDSPMRWSDLGKVKAEVEAEVDTWNGPALVRTRVVVPVYFRRETPEAPWVTNPGSELRVELSRRTPSEDERKTMVSVIVGEKRRRAEERLASLPPVEVPAFATAAEARAYVYKQLLEAPGPELESALRRMYVEPVEDEVAAALAGQAAFKEQYCATPTLKAGRQGFINKDDSFWTEVAVSEAPSSEFKDGKPVSAGFKLTKLHMGLVKGPTLAALKSYSFDLCASVLPKESGGEWKVGDPVEIKYIGSWQPGTIDAIVAGKLWVHDKRRNEVKVRAREDIREPQNPAEAPAPPAANPPAVTFKAAPDLSSLPVAVGDRVEGNYSGRGKWYKGTVKDFNSARNKAFIKYDDGTSEYLSFDKVRKL